MGHRLPLGHRVDRRCPHSHREPRQWSRTLMSTLLQATPGQTVGPFFGYALPFDKGNELVPPGWPGAVQLHGVVTDGEAKPVPDALLEIWQAARDGCTLTGWARASTDDEGPYSFPTVLPGAMQPDSAPFISVTVFARGLLN